MSTWILLWLLLLLSSRGSIFSPRLVLVTPMNHTQACVMAPASLIGHFFRGCRVSVVPGCGFGPQAWARQRPAVSAAIWSRDGSVKGASVFIHQRGLQTPSSPPEPEIPFSPQLFCPFLEPHPPPHTHTSSPLSRSPLFPSFPFPSRRFDPFTLFPPV